MVASLAACWSKLIRLLVSSSIPSCSLSFSGKFNFALCYLSVGIRVCF